MSICKAIVWGGGNRGILLRRVLDQIRYFRDWRAGKGMPRKYFPVVLRRKDGGGASCRIPVGWVVPGGAAGATPRPRHWVPPLVGQALRLASGWQQLRTHRDPPAPRPAHLRELQRGRRRGPGGRRCAGRGGLRTRLLAPPPLLRDPSWWLPPASPGFSRLHLALLGSRLVCSLQPWHIPFLPLSGRPCSSL